MPLFNNAWHRGTGHTLGVGSCGDEESPLQHSSGRVHPGVPLALTGPSRRAPALVGCGLLGILGGPETRIE